MAAVDLKALVGKLNGICRTSLESAAGLTLSRSHYNIEIEHWLLKLLESSNSDLQLLLRHYEVDESRLIADLTRVLDSMKTGNSRAPALSPQVVKLARESWVLASLQYGAPKVRSCHLLGALLLDEGLAPVARESSAQFARIPVEDLQRDMMKIVADSDEAIGESAAQSSEPGSDAPAVATGAAGGTALAQFTINLTQRARNGEIDPVLGRDPEVRQIVDILTRRRQNNPILTGEAGVGKTAVVEGFALRLASGDVPPALQNVALHTLDLGLLQAGAGVKGEFENRLKSVIEEVKASPKPIIMFIDEAHTLIGAGGQAGQGDAANLLKPALARGELRTIAATTWAEYKKYFERDAALARRFQVVKVEEPTEAVAIEMMRGLVDTLEKHHGVRILDEAVIDAVRLSHRYIPGRQLPDKSVSLLDTACARVNMSQAAVPPEIEDRRRRLEQLDVESGILEREAATGGAHSAKLTEIAEQKEKVGDELAELEERWAKERDLIGRIRDLRDKLEGAHAGNGEEEQDPDGEAQEPASEEDMKAWLAELAELNSQLDEMQGEAPLLQVCVDGQAVASVVATWTGIPVGRMVSNEIRQVLNIKEDLEKRIIGQSHALDAIAQAMRTSRAKLTDPRKPIGVFLFCGTSGVGKTETALSLAELLYGGEQNVTTINMSEFKEEHKVSTLMGSPPGYVGYGEGGVLTEAVRRRPYSVILFDEMEKAHAGVQDVFYQLFDKGMLRDGEGRDIDFKNTVIIMTSNAGTDTIAGLCDDPETMPDEAGLAEALRPELLKVFKPAFLGRVTLVPYFPLSDEVIKGIVKLQLDRVAARVRENYKAEFSYDEALIDSIAERCKENESGARNIEHILSRTMLPEMSALFLERMAEGGEITDVGVSVDESGGFEYRIG
ncbi:type VI secretion system ATPase TssH [Denitrobaculum tricleocarpae]|uniref:Type VI secretion system ATPase TssH n=1 Tax=Denitrobaculum tricleocarpae TaxID=2591009 RepID=A0A545TTH4_9PROT|nr:type VI secretion system ATPase TssH [Denitrobaculum tricleocarpae]TQV80451.1 type VI secretion system ATPase TssH [Denitrobaculum tricleocarpae]